MLLLRCAPAILRSQREQAVVELALRQQRAAYARMGSEPRLTPLDRAFWVALSRAWTAADLQGGAGAKPIGSYAGGVTAETIRQSNGYKVMTPEQTVALAQQLGDYSSFYLTPLLGGIDPKRAWKMLRLFEREVLPHLPRGEMPRWGVVDTG